MSAPSSSPTAPDPKGAAFKTAALVAGPLLAGALLLFCDLDPARPAVTRTAAVAILMAVWWIGEAVPLAVTALLPVALFPALGIMSGNAVSSLYFQDVIFLFLGGFMVALAMERWNLHKRIALRILLVVGAGPRRILLGFMLASWFLSMWISNTATAMMMVPIGLALVREMDQELSAPDARGFSVSIFLGIAYGASLGGIATLVGTPPNLAFLRIFRESFPDAPPVSFASWFFFALPLSVTFLALTWLYLCWRVAPRPRAEDARDPALFRRQLAELGSMSFAEKVVLVDFVLLAALWLTRVDLEIGDWRLPGWSRLFAEPGWLTDGTVAMALALPLFVVPSRDGAGGRIMTWETAVRLPWGLVLLFGGGFALASGFMESGLSLWIGQGLEGLGGLPPWLLVMAIGLLLTFLTEITSNTATAQILLPILAAFARSIRVDPLLLMVPATLACSCAFMLPVATPPNAIVFGTDRVGIRDMVRAGFLLNLVGVILITAAVFALGPWALGIDLHGFPEWARR